MTASGYAKLPEVLLPRLPAPARRGVRGTGGLRWRPLQTSHSDWQSMFPALCLSPIKATGELGPSQRVEPLQRLPGMEGSNSPEMAPLPRAQIFSFPVAWLWTRRPRFMSPIRRTTDCARFQVGRSRHLQEMGRRPFPVTEALVSTHRCPLLMVLVQTPLETCLLLLSTTGSFVSLQRTD